ncbi:MAG TPA: Holliday junction resolvase RuvX [Bryobacteraceae bacterium]|nr:Holliday junction resolvase RuvX [Bryobacteraceae bacterium]
MDRSPLGRILALDVGKRRIGIALSDPLGITAQGLPTLERRKTHEDYAALTELACEREVVLILVGNPIGMAGQDTHMAGFVRHFADGLAQRSGLPVRLWDERLTTVQAGRVLRSSGIGIEKRARAVDRLSAVLLLQNYLDSMGAMEASE